MADNFFNDFAIVVLGKIYNVANIYIHNFVNINRAKAISFWGKFD